MEEIKVGEYVRTKYGYIDKIINIERYNEEEKWLVGENFRNTLDSGYYGRTTDNDIVKHSPRLIDLIEVGDYVNGYFCNNITDIDTGLPVLCNFDLNTMEWTPLENIDIWESIVTKEQFKNVMYEVK